MRKLHLSFFGFAFAGLAPFSSATASETSSFTYDALGRLTGACRAGPSETWKIEYQLDAAGNRRNYSSVNTIVSIAQGVRIFSPNGKFMLTMQTDGNLVSYGDFGGGVWNPIGWASNTVGSQATAAWFQGDGNLVLYTASGSPVWSTGTWGNPCATLSIQDDGHVVIRSAAGAVLWTSTPTSLPG